MKLSIGRAGALDRENAALTETGQPPKQKKFETVKDTLRKQISSVLYNEIEGRNATNAVL